MVTVTGPYWSSSLMFHFTSHQFPPLNVGCLFTVQCESPELFPKCGNISQADRRFHPRRGVTYHMSRSGSQKKKGGWQRGRGLLLCIRRHPHPRESFPVPQMSVDNYSAVSNATGRHESLTSDRPGAYQPFLGIHLERTWDLVPRLGGQSPSTESHDL